MKTIKRKIMLAFCLVALCAMMPFATQVNQLLAASEHDLNDDFLATEKTDHDISEPFEVVAAIEERLQGQGTSIVEELCSQRDFYLGQLNNASSGEQASILAMINSLNESIATFERTSSNLPEDSNFGKEANMVTTNSFGSSNVCTCDWLNILLNTRCGPCNALSYAVTAIQAGFWADEFYLAAELLGQSKINRVYGSHYTPTFENAQRLIQATHLKEKIAYSDDVVGNGDFPSPNILEHIPGAISYNADAKYAIGGYTYRKTYYSSTHVNISIKDIYDYDGGDKDPFSAICYEAQLAGIIVPFYTIINDLIVPGTVPFNHEIQNNEVIITGLGNKSSSSVIVPAMIRKFGYEHPSIDNYLPPLNLRIGNSAFSGKTGLTNVTLATSWIGDNSTAVDETGITRNILSIGNTAFSGCLLSQISIPASVKEIGNYAFAGCPNLQEVIFAPNSQLYSVGDGAFLQCGKLSHISLPERTYSIGSDAFANCPNLLNATIPKNVKLIGEEPFRWCDNLNSLTIPFLGSNPYISGKRDLAYFFGVVPKSLKTVNITNADYIPDEAFMGYNQIKTVNLPEGLLNIGAFAFTYTLIEKIVIPESIVSIDRYAFYACGVTDITLPFLGLIKTASENDGYLGYIFGAPDKINQSGYVMGLTSMTLTGGTKLHDYAFYGCDSLTTIKLPASITKAGPNTFTGCKVNPFGLIPESPKVLKGATISCHLDYNTNVPDLSSRLNYIWISSNPEIAIVNEWATITGVKPGRATIFAIYKKNATIAGSVQIEVTSSESSITYLEYGMDVRLGGTISGTEVTVLGQDVIQISKNPLVNIHVDYTRLICLGSDSPSVNIQDFVWTSGNSNIGTVSEWGTIKGISKGVTTISGVYKYDANYKVLIEITVL